VTQTRILLSLIGPLVVFSAVSAQEKLDACSLITKAEIEAVQGEPVTDTKSSAPDRPVFAVAQCFYTVATFTKSVSLEVTRRDPKNPAEDEPRDQWKELFHPAARRSDEHRRSREPDQEGKAGKEASPPLQVKGIGDEAFWIGNAITGGLYILKNDAYFRIGLGGSEDRSVKIEKATALARKAIPRL